MPTPRMTRQNQAKWLFAFIISIVATLVWGKKSNLVLSASI